MPQRLRRCTKPPDRFSLTPASSFSACRMPPITLPAETLRTIRAILHFYVPDREVRAFGSRIQGRAKPHSDLDLCIMGGALAPYVLAGLEEAFSESSLPFKVDVSVWAELSDRFRSIVSASSIRIQPPNRRTRDSVAETSVM